MDGKVDDLQAECCKHDIYVNKDSLEVARLAAGSAIQLTKDIITGKVQNGMCVTRPPGHHAMKAEPNGFCLCNNVGIAAKYALANSFTRVESKIDCSATNQEVFSSPPQETEKSSSPQINVRKILIVDFDVHHGQGTQYAFYDNPNVLYFSIHRYEHGLFWPNLRESDFDSVGEGKGAGYNANLPLNSVGMSDFDYMSIVHQILLPIGQEFQPDLVLVEAGYDAAIGDPEGEMRLSAAAYGHIIHSLMGLAAGKIGVFLEGGYFLDSVAEGATMTIRALLGDFNISLGPRRPLHDSLISSVLNLKFALKHYWKNLNVHDECKTDQSRDDDEPLHIPSVIYKQITSRVESWTTGIYDPNDHYHQHSPGTYQTFKEEVNLLRQSYNRILHRYISIKPKRLALAFDKDMMDHYNNEENNHPEQPKRVEQIYKTHQDYGLLSRGDQGIYLAIISVTAYLLKKNTYNKFNELY